MKAETKIMHQRLEALKLAEELGNVSRVCRERGISPTQFYEYRKRFKEQGFEGLRDLPPIHKTHPQTTSPEVEKRILELVAQHPQKGCGHIEHLLKLEGKNCSKPTIQKIMERHGLGSRYQRLLKLEEEHLTQGKQLSEEQLQSIEKANPCFKERHVESKAPGYLLCQDTLYAGKLKEVGKVYMQTVVDTYGSFAFGYLHTGKLPDHSALILHNDVLPFYQKHDLEIEAILTDNGREYCGRLTHHHYEIYLELNGIEHRKTRIATPKTNGFAERFNRTVKEEFFDIALRQKLYTSVEELQKDLDEWLRHYNYERPHQGYRNMGRRPIETIEVFKQLLQNIRKEG